MMRNTRYLAAFICFFSANLFAMNHENGFFDYMASVSKYIQEITFSNHFLSDEELIYHARRTFSVDDEKALHKIALALFVDLVNEIDDSEKAILKDLETLEWFSGSIATEVLIKEIKIFTQRYQAEELPKKWHQILADFVFASEQGLWQAYAIDALRAKKPFMCLLASTGLEFFKSSDADFDENEIKGLYEKTLSAVEKMKLGDKQLLLTGTQYHETRTLIEKLSNDKWHVTYFDTAVVQKSSFEKERNIRKFKVTCTESINEFLKVMYKTKLSKQSQLSNTNDPLQCLDKFEKHQLFPARYYHQKVNSCHSSSLFAVLANFFNQHEENVLEFMQYFAQYLLQNDKLTNMGLIEFGKKRLIKFERDIVEGKKLAEAWAQVEW